MSDTGSEEPIQNRRWRLDRHQGRISTKSITKLQRSSATAQHLSLKSLPQTPSLPQGHGLSNKGRHLQVQLPERYDIDRDRYRRFPGWDVIVKVLYELEGDEEPAYRARYGDNHHEEISLGNLLRTKGGQHALTAYENGANSLSDSQENTSAGSEEPVQLTSRRRRVRESEPFRMQNTSPDDEESERTLSRSLGKRRGMAPRLSLKLRQQTSDSYDASYQPSQDRTSLYRSSYPTSRHRHTTYGRTAYSTGSDRFIVDDESSSDTNLALPDLSDVGIRRKRRRQSLSSTDSDPRYTKVAKVAARRSDRSNKAYKSMEEVGIDDIYRSDSGSSTAMAKPKITLAKKSFRALPSDSPFRRRHMRVCESCGNFAHSNVPLVNCQGCSLAYHSGCLQDRSTQDHLITKIGEDDYVLQCRRCINVAQKKDHLAPNLGRCQACHEVGPSCIPFKQRRTRPQEQKDRDENGGEDPIVPISSDLINNVDNVMFRCTRCWRAFHYQHLPDRDFHDTNLNLDSEAEITQMRFESYGSDWTCEDCNEAPAEVGGLIAWRPMESRSTDFDGLPLAYDMLEEDDKEYLIKWKDLSYAQSVFMPGAWVWGVTARAMRLAFAKKHPPAKMQVEDAIPEEYLRIDIVLAVEFANEVPFRTVEVDKSRAKAVKRAYVKYKGLGYDDAVWEAPPSSEDGERWVDFVTAYNDWVAGQWLELPKSGPLKTRIEHIRAQHFASLERTKQPKQLVGGNMMKYQLDGLNWIFYQWHQRKNSILADEMGLGKTIQVIAFLTMMVKHKNIDCAPFLVVVPNSTCPSWRRELKKWAPSLRVVTYYGSSTARRIARDYELYPELSNGMKSRDIKAHVIVTSYDAAIDEDARRFFKSVPWQGLIVDEGQRLKSDETILYSALRSLKIPFRLLLTGTPLQNNARELFNLLQFLDKDHHASRLEEEYAEMSDQKIRQLHDLIRPVILRRTKAQVLNFLPVMAQVIIPVSMTTLQKKTYTSILAKNPQLLSQLFSRKIGGTVNTKDRASLSNILIQLRKCLCHPFVYSKGIEETQLAPAVLHRNLVEASAKLQLLDQLLPKLKERGHRVLIFSQFLDMLDILEDFLNGIGLKFNRLDGNTSSLEKQRRIDQFNQPNSDTFAFLLSTRAGGVGINLATADTVVILDPDFNPHQDIQALSRAHRIGQTKKVLCFQVMTQHSAEEKIMQIGRKKMALDHVIVKQLDKDDIEDRDLEGILRHGAGELISGSDDYTIRYDEASIEKLLDRSQNEKTKSSNDSTAESQFSLARVWVNEQGSLEESLTTDLEKAPDPSVWDKILRERERLAAAEAARNEQALGRGQRMRGTVDYAFDNKRAACEIDDYVHSSPVRPSNLRPASSHNALDQRKGHEDSDGEFDPDEYDDNQSIDEEVDAAVDMLDSVITLGITNPKGAVQASGKVPREPTTATSSHAQRSLPMNALLAPNVPPRPKNTANTFKRVKVRPLQIPTPQPVASAIAHSQTMAPTTAPSILYSWCQACGQHHAPGKCPLRFAGIEYCNLCGLAHYGIAGVCPHMRSETQVNLMLQSLQRSNEPPHIREMARRYLENVRSALQQQRAARLAAGAG